MMSKHKTLAGMVENNEAKPQTSTNVLVLLGEILHWVLTADENIHTGKLILNDMLQCQ